ncbi:MAG: porphobilinogen synthase [Cyclobacteriaceae bacterium]|nr:porphobilinogen synthase [Cyclobacteriaceae bacterium]
MLQRPRRNRKSAVVREMVAETYLRSSDLIFPLFVQAGENLKVPVDSMPGIFRLSADSLLKEIESCLSLGLQSVALFPCIEDYLKDPQATEATNQQGLYLSTLRSLKKEFPELTIMTDVAMDPYSSDGHDGLVRNGEIVNDETLDILANMALAQAQAGADIIGPSDMMDGRVMAIRQLLDDNGHQNVSIMSYTAKYASAFYGPFRNALDSAPKEGDKKTYQMDPRNRREALREAQLDEQEGADFLMVKPALAYLDVISDIRRHSNLPVAAYNVSGEYAMIKAAAGNNWLDGEATMVESLTAIKRAGADIILTYFAKEFLQWQKS